MSEGMDAPGTATRIRFVLVNTSHPGNIGSSARAIRTMGFGRLALVAPQRFPHAEALALASGAGQVLADAVVSAGLADAIADCRLVVGATARRRGVSLPELDPRAAARRLLDVAIAGGEVAIVFGNERAGLDNQELARCHAALTIPSDPAFPSLNLAQAVQIVAYELRMALLGENTLPRISKSDALASSGELESFFGHLARMLDDIDFHKGRSPRTIMQRLRRLFLRATPDQRELRILHGILSDAQRSARVAGNATEHTHHADAAPPTTSDGNTPARRD
ncbi:MAG TPA: RNA methyltransferase [Rhodanobacteraceae bacterium]|nr:RNA methyltransferase [Rhodanobacteraceae bacterium]